MEWRAGETVAATTTTCLTSRTRVASVGETIMSLIHAGADHGAVVHDDMSAMRGIATATTGKTLDVRVRIGGEAKTGTMTIDTTARGDRQCLV